MADGNNIDAKLDRIESLLAYFAPASSTPFGSPTSSAAAQLASQASGALGGSPVSTDQAIRGLQDLVKTLNASGVPLSALHKQVNQLVGDAELTRKVMSEFSLGLKELGKLTPREFAKDLRYNIEHAMKASFPTLTGFATGAMSVGGIGLAIEAVAKAFNVVDKALADVNKSLVDAAMQTRTFAGVVGGVGGVFGGIAFKPGGEGAGAAMMAGQIYLKRMNIGQSDQERSQMASMMFRRLPVNLGAETGGALGAMGVLIGHGADLTTASDLTANTIRRLGVTGEPLLKSFSTMYKTISNTNMSSEEGFKLFNQLWDGTRMLGGSFTATNKLLSVFGDALLKQSISVSTITSAQGQSVNARSGAIAGLWSLSRTLGVNTGGLFTGATDVMSAIGAYTTKMAGMSGLDQALLINKIINKYVEKNYATSTPLQKLGYKRQALESLAPQLGLSLTPTEWQQLLLGKAFPGVGIPGAETRGAAKPTGVAMYSVRPEEVRAVQEAVTRYRHPMGGTPTSLTEEEYVTRATGLGTAFYEKFKAGKLGIPYGGETGKAFEPLVDTMEAIANRGQSAAEATQRYADSLKLVVEYTNQLAAGGTPHGSTLLDALKKARSQQ